MIPSKEQIEHEAYLRWERRGFEHGRDQQDWLAAEQDLTFAMNYDALVRHRLDAPDRVLGKAVHASCRYCERSEKEVTFSPPVALIPEFLGNSVLFTREECHECHEQFQETINRDLDRFTAPLREAAGQGRVRGQPRYWFGPPGNAEPSIENEPYLRPEKWGSGRSAFGLRVDSQTFCPVGAFKALCRIALGLMPESDLEMCAQTLEWVSNTDHALDIRGVGRLPCIVYFPPEPFPSAWVSLARRRHEECALPYLVLFVASRELAIQIALPFCQRDEDLDGLSFLVPRISLSGGKGGLFRESASMEVDLAVGHGAVQGTVEVLYGS